MKRGKPVIIVTSLVVVVLIAGLIIFFKTSDQTSSQNSVQTGTTYEDASGWIWECSKPVAVKDQGVKYLNGTPSLTPTNQAEANKYCHKTGVE